MADVKGVLVGKDRVSGCCEKGGGDVDLAGVDK